MGLILNKEKSNNHSFTVIDHTNKYKYGYAPTDCVHHYMPPNLPMEPILNSAYLMDCSKTWKLIITANTDRMRQYGKPGIVLFYDEFFFRLFQRDFTMEDVFPDLTKRSEVLIKALTFILKTNTEDLPLVINRCNYLGHRHRSISGVRPHHFSVYTSTILEVMMYWLGETATTDIGAAWSNIVGFFLYHILEAFLVQKLDPFECYQNVIISAIKDITDSRGDQSDTSSLMKVDQVVPSKIASKTFAQIAQN